jgi:glycosyltransferase involved in cell wall biosynthesis
MRVTVVVPTRNEADNVRTLVARTAATLDSLELCWEMVFVDDSDDSTPEQILEVERTNVAVRLVHRSPNERSGGLGSAVALGFKQSMGSDIVAVMDADLQHPPEVLTALISAVTEGNAEVAIASRTERLGNGGSGPMSWWRGWVSRSARALVHSFFPRLRHVSDPLAGFFAVRQSVIVDTRLRPKGFKILLEVLVRGTWTRIVEVPCDLDPRLHGQSKAHLGQGLVFARHLASLLLPADAVSPESFVPQPTPTGGGPAVADETEGSEGRQRPS